MKSSKLLLFIIIISLNAVAQNDHSASLDQSSVQTLLNSQMPAFSAKDINGKNYNAREFKNKVVFINFWFLDCPPCIQELKQLSHLYYTVANNPNVIFLTINSDNSRDIKSFMSVSDTLEIGGKIRANFKKQFKFNNAIQYPIISDTNKIIQRKFKIDIWPVSLIVGKDGIIKLINVGLEIDNPENYLYEKYSKKISDLLEEK